MAVGYRLATCVVTGLSLWLIAGVSWAGDTSTQPPAPGIPSGPIAAEKLQADLEVLVSTIKEVHPNPYAYVPEAEAAMTFDRLRPAVDRPMTRKDFYRLVAPGVASLKNGHTFVHPFAEEFKAYIDGGGGVFPIAVQFEQERVILRDCLGEGSLPLGGEILAINRQGAKELCQRYASYMPGEGRAANPAQIERAEVLWVCLWLDFGADNPLELKIKGLDGKTATYAINPVTFEEIKSRRGLLSSGKSPYEFRYLEDSKCGLITMREFKDRTAFGSLLKKTFHELRSNGATSLIIDLRSCPGGDSQCGDMLLDYLTDQPFRQFERCEMKMLPQFVGMFLPASEYDEARKGALLTNDEIPLVRPKQNPLRFQGRKIVLIGRKSFSSSNSFAGCVKHYGIATLVGEEAGDPTDCYGECFNVTLPNSGITVSIAAKHFVCPGSLGDGRGAMPDHEVKQTPEDLAVGKDTVLAYALEQLRKASTGKTEPPNR